MPRTRPADRLDRLVAAAARVFTAKGYRRAQMADVAHEMGVAPGTLYLYVESKEALFDLVIRRAFADDAVAPEPKLPLPTPTTATMLSHLRRRARLEAAMPHLEAALRRRQPADAEEELRAVVRELYGVLLRSRGAVRLLERSALDWPELAAVWSGEIRHNTIAALTRHLERRMRQKLLRPAPSVEAAARLLLETCAWFAVHRFGDAEPPAVEEGLLEETVVDLLVHSLSRRTRP